MTRKLFLTALLLAAAVCLPAKIRLPHVLGSNMVIQQNTQVRLWGWAAANSTLTIMLSWTDERIETTTDENGWWFTTIPSPKASYTPLSITLDDGDEQLNLDNILSGEVWVCGGQSNMEMPVRGFPQCPVDNYNAEVLDAAKGCQVRSIKIPAVMRETPQDDAAGGEWRECSPETVGDFSATGYFFAKLMNKALDVPIGLIEANKGGSRLESWLTKENLETFTQDPVDSAAIAAKWPTDYLRSLLWGNGTFNPIVNYTVKGLLYYQGCSNVGDKGDQYSERMKLLVSQWREQFGLGELPFYFVEIAPYYNGDVDGDWAALLREQQFKASRAISNCGLVCTNDCVYPYETTQIHPAQKQKVGQRLAFMALNKTYGMKHIIAESPCYKDMQVRGDTVFIHLDNAIGGINRFDGIEGFEVAGADKKFHTAKAMHFWRPGGGYWDECIAIVSPRVKQPVAVRYCFRNFKTGNLANAGGLPLFPFRSDNW